MKFRNNAAGVLVPDGMDNGHIARFKNNVMEKIASYE